MNLRFFLPAALLLFPCCTQVKELQETLMASVKFSVCFVDGGSVKSTDSSTDDVKDNVQIGVYDVSGHLCASGRISEGSLELTLPLGQKGYKVVALVNSKSDLSSCTTLQAVTSLKSSLVASTSKGVKALEMFALDDGVTFKEGEPYVVYVHRIPAKVEIDSIVNRIESRPDFSIEGIYLINVNASCDVLSAADSPEWMQKRKYIPSQTDVVKYTSDIFSRQLSYNSSYDTKHYFYCCANPTTSDTSSETWSARYTRLVVEALYDGTRYYYPINIVGEDGTLHGGCLYKISKLTITGPGSLDPDVPVARSEVDFTVEISDWEYGFTQNVTY